MLGRHGGSIVWSPLSNLLLYGATARVDEAKRAGVRIGLGSDWSPSGSKNLLGELKVAWLYSQHLLDGLFSARDLVAMATRDAAAILKWQQGARHAGARQARRSDRDRRQDGRSVRGADQGQGNRDPAGDDQRHRALRHAGADEGAGGQGRDAARGGADAPACSWSSKPATPTSPTVSLSAARERLDARPSAICPSWPWSWRSRSPKQAMRAPRCTAAGGVVAGAGRDSADRSRASARGCPSTGRVTSPGPISSLRARRRHCRRFFSPSSWIR